MAQTTIEQFIVEVDGETEKLKSELAALQKQLDDFRKKGQDATKPVEAGADNLGEKFGKSARQVAGATEQIARMGQVSGESIKQIVAQGSEMASFFGPTGAWVGAVGIAGVAIIEMLDRAEKKMEETQRKFGESVAQMVKSGNLIALGQAASDLYGGEGPFAKQKEDESAVEFRVRQMGVARARARMAALQEAERQARAKSTELGPAKAGEFNAIYSASAQAERSLKQAEAATLEWQKALNLVEAQYASLLPAIDKVTAKVADEAKNSLEQLQSDAAPRYAAMVEQARAALAGISIAADQSISGGTKSAVDNARAALRAYQESVTKAKVAIEQQLALPATDANAPDAATRARLEQILKDIKAVGEATVKQQLGAIDQLAEKEATSIRANLEKSVGELTGSLAQNAIEAISEQNRQLVIQVALAEKLTDAEKQRLFHLIDVKQMLEKQKAIAADAVRDVDRTIQAADLAGPLNSSFTAINAKAIELRQTMAAMVKEGGELAKQGDGYKSLVDALLKLDKERAALLAKMLGVTKEVGETEKDRLHAIEDQARAIQQSVEGALQLAEAMGLADARTVAMLQNITKIAGNIPSLVGQIGLLGKVDASGKALGNMGAVLGAALPIAGAIAGLVGGLNRNEAERERVRVVEENTKALKDLTAKAASGGLLGKTELSGSALLEALAGLATITGRFSRTDIAYARDHKPGTTGLDTRADLSGLSREQLDAINAAAKALGLTLNETGQSFYDLMISLSKSFSLLGEFGKDFADAMRQMDAESRIFGDKGPLASLQSFFAKIGPLAPGIAGILGGLDASHLSAEDLETIRLRVQSLFETMQAGGDTLQGATLGKLSGDEFLQALEQIVNYLNAITEHGKTASEQLSDMQRELANDLAIFDIRNPGEVFSTKAQKYAGIGGALGDLLKGFDLKNADPENIRAIDDALKEFYKQLKDGGDGIDLAGLSIDELIQILLDLHGAADDVADGVSNAVDQINEALNKLSLDEQIFGSTPTEHAQNTATAYGLDLSGFDLTTPAGVAAAKSYLQGLYRDNPALGQAIAAVIAALNAIPFTTSGALVPRGGGGALGDPNTSVTQEIRTITVEQGGRMLDTMTAILATLTATLPDIRDWLMAAASSFIPTPSIPARFAGSGSVQFSVSIVVNGDVGTTSVAALSDLVERELYDRFMLQGGIDVRNALLLKGNTIQR